MIGNTLIRFPQMLGRVVFCMALSIAQAQANDTSAAVLDSIAKLSYNLSYVSTFGEWHNATEGGVYRLVVLDAQQGASHSLMFIQAIESKQVDGKWVPDAVIRTEPVNEINLASVFRIQDPKTGVAGEAKEPVIEVIAVNQYTKTLQGFRITPKLSGGYLFTTTNGQAGGNATESSVHDAGIAEQIKAIPATFEYYMRPTF